MQEEVLAIVTVSMRLCVQNVCVLRARQLYNHRNRSEKERRGSLSAGV